MFRRSVLLVLASVILASSFTLLQAKPAGAIELSCESIPLVGCSATEITDKAAQSIFDLVSRLVGDATSWAVGLAGQKILEVSDVRRSIREDGFLELYERDMAIGIILLVPLLLAACIRALIRGLPGELTRIFVLYIPVAVVGGFVAIFIVDSILMAIDALSAIIYTPLAPQIADTVQKVAYAGVSSITGTLLLPIIGLFLILAAFAVLFELIARDVLILATLAFVPLAFAGMVWSVTAGWLERSLRGIASLALMKLIMVILLSAGALVLSGQLTSPLSETDFANMGFKQVSAETLRTPPANCGSVVNSGADVDAFRQCIDDQLVRTFGVGDEDSGGTAVLDKLAEECLADFGSTPAEENTLNAAVEKAFGCYQIQTGPNSQIDFIRDKISSSADVNAGLSALVTNGLVGIVLFGTVALSPAIAFRLFDIFEGNIEQLRYARRGTTISPISRAAQAQTTVSVADLLTNGRASQEV